MKRDTIFIEEKINELIKFNEMVIKEWLQELDQLNQGINHYKRPIEEVIRLTKEDISIYQERKMIATYTAGYPIEKFKEEYLTFVDSLVPVWHSNSGYDEMLWALSIGILLEIDEMTFEKLVDLVRKDDPEDYLIDYQLCKKCLKKRVQMNLFLL